MRAPATLVLNAIARAVLNDAGEEVVTVGAITLHPHQREALLRIRESIDRTGGALLADEPGLGKTFVALALAREVPEAIVVAPAALRAMWRSAAATAGVELRFVSMEALSRGSARVESADVARDGLVIVDEAHHVCNRATARYGRLARLVAYRRVLLLSATPVRNRRAELAALLALFMGPRAYTLDAAARSRCIVQRGARASLLPAVDGPHWHRVRGIPRLAALIEALPPPLPALDGRQAGALLAISLARCWASSLGALDAALRRRLQRGAALAVLLDDGRVPTRDELRAWVVGDDAVQLAFPIFASHQTPDAARLRAVLDAHLEAVRALRARIRARVDADARARARLLLGLRRAHPGARIVAFTAHAATATALYRALGREEGVALLTARGARTAGGARPRSDVIEALGAAAEAAPGTTSHARSSSSRRDDVSLVITTDLLSEGVNLQGASVVVHLDVPWTPAGLAQRVGRAARMGSRHRCVHVHGIATPAGAERLLRLERRLTKKHAEQLHVSHAPREIEQLRAVVRTWPGDSHAGPCDGVGAERNPLVATASGTRRGFIAVIEEQGARSLVCGVPRGGHRWKVSDLPADLHAAARAVDPTGVDPSRAARDDELERSARAALGRWLSSRRAREAGGEAGSPSRERRRLLARLDAAVRGAGVHTRAICAERVARVRTLIHHAISAGAERTIGDLARTDAVGLEALLAACDAGLDGGAPRLASNTGQSPALRALLLLQRVG